jgi:hypothetical protein
MKLIKAEVEWHDGFANRPTLEITVDKIPDKEHFRFQNKGRLYFAEHDGYVRFFAGSTTENEGGFGSRKFPITLHNGNKVTLLGPWSSRASYMNQHFEPHCVDVYIYETESEFTSGIGGAVTLEVAEKAAEMAGYELEREVSRNGDINYEIKDWEQHKAERRNTL